MRVGKGEEFVPPPPVRELRTPKKKPMLAKRGGQGGHLRNDSRRLVRQPHDVSPLRHIGEDVGECLSTIRTHVVQHRRVEYDELGVARYLGQHARKVINQVASADSGRVGPGQFDRTFEPSPTLRMIRPNARPQPPDRIIVMHVDRTGIQTPSPDNLRNRRGEWDGSSNHAPQVNGRGRLADGSRSEVVIETVEEQAQASACTHFDERQGSGRKGRKQHGTAPDLVRLCPA